MPTDYGPSGSNAAPSTSALRTGPSVSDRSACPHVITSNGPTLRDGLYACVNCGNSLEVNDGKLTVVKPSPISVEQEWRMAAEAEADAGDEARQDASRLRADNERLRAAADEAITTLALLRGYVEPGEAWDSEPWLAINACIRSVMQATGESTALASDVREAE